MSHICPFDVYYACESTGCAGGRYCQRNPKSQTASGLTVKEHGVFGGFQVCPMCHGEGTSPADINSMNTTRTCPVCTGERVISVTTGLPPTKHKNMHHHLFKAFSLLEVGDEKGSILAFLKDKNICPRSISVV